MEKYNNPLRVMVLGGEGQIGVPLCDFLKKKKHKVYNVDLLHGEQEDLRKMSDQVSYWFSQVDFVFFLAYDIGGSKFLKTKQNDFDFLMNNTKIMQNVFTELKKHKKPFLFASSSMANMPWSSYGNLKKLGEHFTETLEGISVRLWNVYGPEHDELKSHVITDFINKAKNTGKIEMLTDGTETRQMLYVEDCCKALYSLMLKYEQAKKYKKFDLSVGLWSSIYDIAQIIAGHYDVEVIRPKTKDTVQLNSRVEPDKTNIEKFWDPGSATSLKDGIHKMIKYYESSE